MVEAGKQQRPHWQRRRLATAAAGVAPAMLAAAAFAAAIAFAAPGTVRINATSNAKLGERLAVNAQGLTLYALSPETASHLLCKSSECLSVWPPVTVPSRKTKLKAGSGLQGRLGVLRRSDGRLQVTLRGQPLYRFANDRVRGEANGQGINSFGGTWHAVTASASPASSGTPPTSPPPTSPPPTSPPPTSPPPTSPPPTSPPPSPPPGYGYGY